MSTEHKDGTYQSMTELAIALQREFQDAAPVHDENREMSEVEQQPDNPPANAEQEPQEVDFFGSTVFEGDDSAPSSTRSPFTCRRRGQEIQI